MKKERKNLEGGRCLKGRDGQLDFIEKDKAKIWKKHMVETNVEGPAEKLAGNQFVKAMQQMKLGKASRPSEVSVEMIDASGDIKAKVMMELCQGVLDGRGMPNEGKTSEIVSNFKGKGYVMSCGSYRRVKLLENTMKVVEWVLERRIRTLMN